MALLVSAWVERKRGNIVEQQTRQLASKQSRRSLRLCPILLLSPGVTGNGALVRAFTRAGERVAAFTAALPHPPPVSR
eukprot:1280872-Prymnesium_polylepis.1